MKTPKEILLETIPKDCYWEDMENLTNTPIHYVIEAMENYAKQKLNIHSVMQAEGSERPSPEILYKVHTEMYGEKIDNLNQLSGQIFDGGELYELCVAFHQAACAQGATVGKAGGDASVSGGNEQG